MRWKIALTWRVDSKTRKDVEKIVTDLADVGPLLAEGPKDWLTAYVCATALVDLEKPAAKLTQAEAA